MAVCQKENDFFVFNVYMLSVFGCTRLLIRDFHKVSFIHNLQVERKIQKLLFFIFELALFRLTNWHKMQLLRSW